MASQQATGAGTSLGSMQYAQASPLQRFMRRFAASGPGSWFFARVLHHVDRPIHRMTRGRHTCASLLSGLPVIMLSNSYMNEMASEAVGVGVQKALLKVRCTPSA